MKIYFISGHRDITQEEFDKYYIPELKKAISENSLFVVAECQGVDTMAQIWLAENIDHPKRVTVYHMKKLPRYLASGEFNTIGGFDDDISRDEAMTKNSNTDIAYIRPGRWTSGTAQNILRRYEIIKG